MSEAMRPVMCAPHYLISKYATRQNSLHHTVQLLKIFQGHFSASNLAAFHKMHYNMATYL